MPTAEKIEASAPSSVEDTQLDLYVERVNLVDGGKRFRAHFMTPGIINYDDVPGGGKELLRKPTIDEALETLLGAPLTIGHIDTKLTDFEGIQQGNVDKVGFDAEKGWHYAEGPVDTDQARKAIDEGWGISVGTKIPKNGFGPGGSWLNNHYDREINRLRFHHLALIRPGGKPRFEDAEIARINSKPTPTMFKWIKKLAGKDGAAATEQASEVDGSQKLDIGEGKTATIAEIVEVARQNAVHAMGADDYIEHEGVRYNCGECVKAYREKMAPKGHHAEERPNEAAPAATLEKPADAKAAVPGAKPESELPAGSPDAAHPDAKTDAERANAVAAEAQRVKDAEAAAKSANDARILREEQERQNEARRSGAQSFTLLANARQLPPPVEAVPMTGTLAARVAKGKQLFGSGR